MIKALTLIQPWGWAILHGKDVENRSWAPPAGMVGQRIAIHAGKRYDKEGELFVAKQLGLERLPDEAHRQGVIGTAVIDRAVATREADPAAEIDLDPLMDSPWFSGPWGWVLRDVRELERPIACKGMLGLWRLPEALEAALTGQLKLSA